MTGYQPLNVPKPVADGIWLIDGPPVTCRRMPHPTRATVVRLQNGDLWVHSPTQMTAALAEQITPLGPVAHLIAPNRLHYTGIPPWQAHFPDATTWAAPGVRERADEQGFALTIDQPLLGHDTLPWDDDLDQHLVGGSKTHQEVAFFHRASRTLILTDIIQNFETQHLPVWMRPLIWFSGADDSDGRMPSLLRMGYHDKPALARSVETMINWRPRRIILSHGRCFEANAVGELERAFRRELRGHRWGQALDQMEQAKDADADRNSADP